MLCGLQRRKHNHVHILNPLERENIFGREGLHIYLYLSLFLSMGLFQPLLICISYLIQLWQIQEHNLYTTLVQCNIYIKLCFHL